MCLLKQTERICLLLIDDKYNEEATKYQKSVDALKESVQGMVKGMNSSQGPELPRRESLADKEAMRVRYRPEKYESNYSTIDGPESFDDIPSDDDNDEIYNYQQSVMAQIHSTSAENLARFHHTDECDDDVEVITKSLERMEANLTSENSDYESDSATKL